MNSAMGGERWQHLMRLAGDKSSASRNQLFAQVGDLMLGGEAVNDHERSLMIDILSKLIRDVEMQMRQQLAGKLAKSPDAPKELVVMLANDDIEVAKPILLGSELLRDWDLIEVIHHRTREHQMAIAMRERVSEVISTALVEAGHEDVITTLLQNQNAKISQATLEYLVEQSHRVDTFQNPLLARADLKPEMAKKMYQFVSDALREKIADDFGLNADEIAAILEENKPAILAQPDPDSYHKTMELVEIIASNNTLSPSLLAKALRDGEIPLFIGMLSKMTQLNLNAVRKIVFEAEGEVVAMTLKAVDFDPQQFADVYKLVRITRAGTRDVRINEMTQLLQYFGQLKKATAQNVVRTWQRDPQYLEAALKPKVQAKPAPSRLAHQPLN